MIRNRFMRVATTGLLGLMSFATFASAATVYGGTTTVNLNAGTVTALVGLGFTITPIAPSTLGGTPLAATFPITGGSTTTDITHSGGLAFAKGSTTVDIENFIINLSGPAANTITGKVVDGSTVLNGVTFFDIGTGLALTLDSQLAGALTSIYSVPNLTGAAIGTASLAPVTTPEPASVAIMGLGLVMAGFFARRQSRTNR